MPTQLQLKKARIRRKRARKKHPFDYEAFREKRQVNRVGHLFDDDDGELKMSEVLVDFADPILDHQGSDEKYDRDLAFAAFAWNIATMPPDMQGDIYESTVNVFTKDMLIPCESVRARLDDLIDRKLQYFNHIHLIIVDYRVVEEGDYRRVLVASTPIKDLDD